MADSKTTTTKTIAGGLLTSTPVPMTGYYKTNSEFVNCYGMAAIKADGSVVAWGQNNYVPESLNGTIDVTQIYSSEFSFVALRSDGSLIPLGYQNIDSETLKKLDGGTIDVTAVSSTWDAFAAIRADGSVVGWGSGNTGKVASQLDGTIDVVSISTTPQGGFAAIRADGSVVTWGDSSYGGDSSTVAKQLDGTIDVVSISSTQSAFAAIRTDGSVVTWGAGSNSSAVADKLDGTIDVTSVVAHGYSGNSAFAAIRADGSVVTWGNDSAANSSSVAKQLDGSIDVTSVVLNWRGAAAAIREDGSVVTWGDANAGGDSSGVSKKLDGTIDVTSISATEEGAFAALRTDGSVITWGNPSNGGDSSSVASQLDGTVDVVKVISNHYAFAALKSDGSVVTWGNARSGGDSSSVAKELDGTVKVVEVNWNYYAFSALREDGSLITWGDRNTGGNSDAVYEQVRSGVEGVANIATNEFYTAKDKVVPPPPPPPNAKGTLTIDGIAKENETLTFVNKITDENGLGEMNYQWLSDGDAIIGAIQPSYVLSQMDVGKKISVAAFYTDKVGVAESVKSDAVKIANVNDLPVGKVSISGTTAKGQTLTATDSLTDIDGMGEVSYQWLREGTPIAKAVDSTYTLSALDMFKTISVKASYTDLQGTKESVLSASTAKISAPVNHAPTGAVQIQGDLIQNRTLTVSNNIADVDGISTDISYQWLIDSKPIDGATKNSYFLTQSDVQKTVSVKATYTDKLGKLESVFGGVVQNENDQPVGDVTINGIIRVDETLSVQNYISDIDGMSGDFQYEWRSDGEAFAEGDTLTLTDALVGKKISVAVQYTDNGGTFESVTSPETTNVIPRNTLPDGYVIVMGEQKNGAELSVLSTLADVDGLGEFSYQWLSGDTPINGETTPTYKLSLGDVGDRISVNVQYVDGYGTLESVTSSDTAAIQSSYVNGLILDSKDSIVKGTDKNDVLSGSVKTTNYSISALAGNDVVSGNVGNDTLDGGKGDDKILGGKGNDQLIGGDGNDTLKGGVGNDTMQGGDGNDYYFVDNVKDVIAESNKNGRLGGNDTVESTIIYTLDKNFENLVLAGDQKIDGTGNEFANEISGNFAGNVLKGEAGNDDITGYKGADTLFGGEGEDVLDGGEDADVLNGDAGDDFLEGGESSDTLNGGDGEDVAIFNSSQVDYQISRNVNDDNSVQLVVKYIGSGMNEGTDILNNIEMLKFGDDEAVNVADVKDTVIPEVTVNPFDFSESTTSQITSGSDNADSILGGSALDKLSGGKSDDTISGNAGNDWLSGGDGNDVINGNDGDDFIYVGAGVDVLTGGAGADKFVFSTKPAVTERNTITDFLTSQADKIDLSEIDAIAATAAKDDTFTLIASGTKFTAEGQLRFNAATNTIEAHTTGTTDTVDFSVVLVGVTAVTATDFVL